MLIWLLIIPIISSIIILLKRKNEEIKIIALITTIINFIISLKIWLLFDNNIGEPQLLEKYKLCTLGIDGISLIFILLTTLIMVISILGSWSIKNKIYFIIILLLETILIGIFIVLDILIFYILFESSLIPIFFLIGIYGKGIYKIKANYMLFIFTLTGSLFMLIGIIFIYNFTGTTDLLLLKWNNINIYYQKFIWLGIFIALAIKIPLIPFHIWLPYAHTEAPLIGSILLAGIQLKLAIYAFIKINIILLPEATIFFTPLIYTLSILSIIYSSFTTLRQIDLKSIIAYSSISHMSIILLGILSNNIQGIIGGLYLSITHGITSPALFILINILYEKTGSRIINYYRGLVINMPIFTILLFIFLLSNMATPLTGNFIGELLCLLGSFDKNAIITILASLSIILSGGYSIWIFNRICFGQKSLFINNISDINRREFFLLLPLLIIIIYLGIFPNIIFNILYMSVSLIINSSSLVN